MQNNSVVEEKVVFGSHNIQLEGCLSYPEVITPESAFLLLSPHPHMGGNMENNVIRHVAHRIAEDGLVSLRFNYRGVGDSSLPLSDNQSRYEYWAAIENERRYEEIVPDIVDAVRFLHTATGGLPWSCVGYSLGAILAGMLPDSLQPCQILAVSPPVKKVSLDCYQECVTPKVFFVGDPDFAHDSELFSAEYEKISSPKSVVQLSGMDHFFRGKEEQLYLELRKRLSIQSSQYETREGDVRLPELQVL